MDKTCQAYDMDYLLPDVAPSGPYVDSFGEEQENIWRGGNELVQYRACLLFLANIWCNHIILVSIDEMIRSHS